jgi:obg-like ATPase 1
VVDIAGLVKGAHEGQGLGNAFLSHISACDGIFHLCRVFDDDDVTHVEGDVNPVRDIEIIHEELRLKDEEYLHARVSALEKTVVRGGDKKGKPEFDDLVRITSLVADEKKQARFCEWTSHEIETLNKHLLLTSKPMIYLVNMSEKDFIRKKNKWLVKIKEWVDKRDPGAVIIPFSATFEAKIAEMEEGAAVEYMNGCGVQRLMLSHCLCGQPDQALSLFQYTSQNHNCRLQGFTAGVFLYNWEG